MTNPKVPTSIVDKNGKPTTVHKNAVSDTPAGRISGIAKPVPTARQRENTREAVGDYLNTTFGVSSKLIELVSEAAQKHPAGDARNFSGVVDTLGNVPAWQSDYGRRLMIANELFKYLGREEDIANWASTAIQQDAATLEGSYIYAAPEHEPTKTEKGVSEYFDKVFTATLPPSFIAQIANDVITDSIPAGSAESFLAVRDTIWYADRWTHEESIQITAELFKHLGREADTEAWASTAPNNETMFLQWSERNYGFDS